MTVTINTKELLKVFDKYSCFLPPPNKSQINNICFLIEKEFYKDIIYGYDEEYVAVVLKYFEIKEQYEICAKIKGVIDSHNEISSVEVQSVLEEC